MTIKTILVTGKDIEELTNKFDEEIESWKHHGFEIILETYRMSESMSQTSDEFDWNITLSILAKCVVDDETKL